MNPAYTQKVNEIKTRLDTAFTEKNYGALKSEQKSNIIHYTINISTSSSTNNDEPINDSGINKGHPLFLFKISIQILGYLPRFMRGIQADKHAGRRVVVYPLEWLLIIC